MKQIGRESKTKRRPMLREAESRLTAMAQQCLELEEEDGGGVL
jgi:hypothetical protein